MTSNCTPATQLNVRIASKYSLQRLYEVIWG